MATLAFFLRRAGDDGRRKALRCRRVARQTHGKERALCEECRVAAVEEARDRWRPPDASPSWRTLAMERRGQSSADTEHGCTVLSPWRHGGSSRAAPHLRV